MHVLQLPTFRLMNSITGNEYIDHKAEAMAKPENFYRDLGRFMKQSGKIGHVTTWPGHIPGVPPPHGTIVHPYPSKKILDFK